MFENGYKIVGYLAEWTQWTAEGIELDKMTHINYAFVKITDGVVNADNLVKLNEFKKLKEKSPQIQTLFSIGGWGAEGFSDAALTEDSRNRFTDSAVKFMTDHGFDGIDLDWEYPCSSEADIKSRPEDKHNFTLLIKSLHEKLLIVGKEVGKKYLLTIAAGAMDRYIADIELIEISEVLDFINLMTYDFINGFSTKTGHHTNLYSSICDDGNRLSSDMAVQHFINAGVPASKIILGCAFYGRGWRVSDSENNGLYEQASSGCREYFYNSLASDYINKNGFIRYWDASAKAPFLWNGKDFISYEDSESLGSKVEYIKAKGLGGTMFWEYTQDSSGILLNRLFQDLK